MVRLRNGKSTETPQPSKKKQKTKETECSQLHTIGYEVFKGALKEECTQQVLSNCKRQIHRGNVIFNQYQTTNSDKKRSQIPLKPENPTMERFQNSVNSFLIEKYPNLIPKDMVILKSLPGCQRQHPHTDYVPRKELLQVEDEYMPLGCIVGLMGGTKLYVWENSIKDNRKCKETLVYLEPGDVLVFRGDFVHAGADYEDYNYRVHSFLDSPKVVRGKNETYFVENIE